MRGIYNPAGWSLIPCDCYDGFSPLAGRMNAKNLGRENEWFRRQHDPYLHGYRELSSQSTFYQKDLARVMGHALQEIVHAVFTGEPVRSNGETALATLKVCQKLAAQTRREK